MSTFGLPITCALCGSETELLASSTAAGSSTNATVRCTDCGSQFLVSVQLRRITQDSAHRRADERRRVSA